jgi:GT2 family glycosyltransferase
MSEAGAADISVVVLNYNGRRWLKGCLSAVESGLGATDELVVVDNASTDGSTELVRHEFPGARLLALDRNLGFAAGNNQGARVARGKYLAFLNNDTVPQPGWLTALRDPFDQERLLALTTARIVYLHNPMLIDSAGDGYLRAGGAFKRFHGESASRADQSGVTFGACGAACMIRRDVFFELDGFDEDFFMVYEDVDLSYRARLRGYTCAYAAKAVVHHVGSGTLQKASPTAVFYGQRNLEWAYFKNTPWTLLLRSLPSHLLYDAAALVSYGSRGLLAPYVRAKWSALRGLPALFRKRSVVQRTRRAAPQDLWNAMDSHWIRRKRDEKRFDASLEGDVGIR